MVKTYCQGHGYIQIINETQSLRIAKAPRVYTNHNGDMCESRCIAKAKGIYRSSSWRHVEE